MRNNKRQWAGKTDGGALGQRMLIWMLSIVNPTVLYWPMALVVPFYMIVNRKQYLAIYGYFRERFGCSPWRAFWKTWRNHTLFGQCMLDKFAVYAGRKDFFEISIKGAAVPEQSLQSSKGVIVATAHVGNFELVGYMGQLNMNISDDQNPFSLLQRYNRGLHILVYGGEEKTILSEREKTLSRDRISLLQAGDVFTLREVLQRGDVVNITCDRFNGNGKGGKCDFLNGRADFPAGTFALAAHLGVPVLTVFCMKEGRRRYHLYFKLLDGGAGEDGDLRKETQNLAQSYARSIEEILRIYPEQWFNFYNFWQ